MRAHTKPNKLLQDLEHLVVPLKSLGMKELVLDSSGLVCSWNGSQCLIVVSNGLEWLGFGSHE